MELLLSGKPKYLAFLCFYLDHSCIMQKTESRGECKEAVFLDFS